MSAMPPSKMPPSAMPPSAMPARHATAHDSFADSPPLPPPPEHFGSKQKQTGLIVAFCAGGVLLILAVVFLFVGFGASGAKGDKPLAKGDSSGASRSDSPPVTGKRDDTPRPVPAAFDQFGNPQGDFRLGRDMEFVGRRILVWADWEGIGDEQKYLTDMENPLWIALKKMGFEVVLKDGPFPSASLKDFDQLWIFSGPHELRGLDPTLVVDFVRSGKGLYLLADNDPYHVDANAIANVLFGTRERGLDDATIRKYGGEFPINDHPLFTGVNFIYEGITTSNFQETPLLKTIMNDSAGKPLVGVSLILGTRVVVDCGFTRYCYDRADPKGRNSFITRVAGSQRFGENVAAFLSGKDR
jgi:hypothetical protein